MSDSRQNPNQDNHFEDDYTSEYDNRGFGSAIVESVKQKPLGYAAFTVLASTLSYAFWKYKKDPKYAAKPSLFLIQLRVAAQGLVIGTISLGLLHQMYQQRIANSDKKTQR